MAIAEKLQNIINEKSQQATMTNYGLTSENQINSSTKFIDYPKYIYNAFLESLRNPDTLFTNLPKKSGSGSNITLNDTANAPMRIELGASELSQAGTPTPDSPQDIHTISGSNKVVINGKQLFNNEDLEIGSIDVNTGANTNTSTSIRTKNYIIVESNTTYAFYRTESTNLKFRYYDKDYNYLSGYGASDLTAGTLTTPNNTKFLRITIDMSNDFNYKLQLQKGSTIPETFTPYTLQETNIDLRTYTNLFDKSTALTDKLVNASNGNVGNDTGTTASDFIYIKGLTNIILSGTTVSYGNGGAFYDESKTFVSGFSSSTIKNGIAVPSNAYYVRFNTLNTAVNTTMLNKGTIALPYTPYNDIEYGSIGNYEDKFIRTSGKNYIDNTNLAYNYSNVSSSYNQLSTIDTGIRYKTTYNNGSPVVVFKSVDLTNYVGKTIRFKANFGSKGRITLALCNADASSRTTIQASTTSGNTISYVVPNNLGEQKYLAYYLGIVGATGNDTEDFTDLILTIDNDDMSYEPYGSNEWYIKKNIGKYTIPNNAGSYNSGSNWFYIGTSNFTNINSTANTPLLSTHFENIKLQLSGNENVNGIWNIGTHIVIRNTALSSAGDYQTFFTNNNVIMYSPLATPTYTQITGTLANQLENVYKNMLSQKGQTNISQVNNDLAFELSVSAIEGL